MYVHMHTLQVEEGYCLIQFILVIFKYVAECLPEESRVFHISVIISVWTEQVGQHKCQSINKLWSYILQALSIYKFKQWVPNVCSPFLYGLIDFSQ